MKTSLKNLACVSGALALAAFSPAVQASVSETDGLGTSWLGTPSYDTAASPTSFGTSEGNFGSSNGAGGFGALAQSFELSSAGTLSSIQLYLAGAANTFHVELYDLGAYPATGYPATSASYTAASQTDLLAAGDTFSYNGGAGGVANVAQLQFSGADSSVSLSAGELYALEIDPTSAAGTDWYRAALTDNGEAYRENQFTTGNMGALNGAIRDFGMAVTVTPVPEPSSFALMGAALAGAGLLRRRQK